MNIRQNIKISDGARTHILRHYLEPEVDDPSKLRSIPTLRYVLCYKDSFGNPIKDAIVGYVLFRMPVENITNETVFLMDGENKYFAIALREEDGYFEDAFYTLEREEGINYLIVENRSAAKS
jgi:hypothetical protein